MNKMTDVALLNGAIKIAPETKLKVAQNMEFSKRMLDIAMSDTSNPQVQAENQVKLAGLQRELGPKAFDGLLQVSKNSAEMLQKQRAFNEANPAWTTMRKYGAYELEYRKGNKTLFDRVNSARGGQATGGRPGRIRSCDWSGVVMPRSTSGLRDSGASGPPGTASGSAQGCHASGCGGRDGRPDRTAWLRGCKLCKESHWMDRPEFVVLDQEAFSDPD